MKNGCTICTSQHCRRSQALRICHEGKPKKHLDTLCSIPRQACTHAQDSTRGPSPPNICAARARVHEVLAGRLGAASFLHPLAR